VSGRPFVRQRGWILSSRFVLSDILRIHESLRNENIQFTPKPQVLQVNESSDTDLYPPLSLSESPLWASSESSHDDVTMADSLSMPCPEERAGAQFMNVDSSHSSCDSCPTAAQSYSIVPVALPELEKEPNTDEVAEDSEEACIDDIVNLESSLGSA
jgi:hypothetical protein